MQLKSLVRFPVDIKRARKRLATARTPLHSFSERPIVLDLKTPKLLFDCGRHFASLAFYSQAAGSPFFVRCNKMMLACIARKQHGREMLEAPYARWIPSDQPLPGNALVLCDDDAPALNEHRYRMLIGRDTVAMSPVMPYPMHPATLRHATRENLQRLRNSRRKFRMFFAGNQKTKYGDDKMHRNFGVLSRLDVLSTLKETYASRVVSDPKVASERSIVLADSRVTSIAASRWLDAIAESQFFVCCPGSSQPVCHNLVEAMSVGTIPLIEYGDRLTPGLVDGINAITFRGAIGLINAIKRIESLTPGQIETMRFGAAKFYDDYLRGEQFLADLRDGQLECQSRQISMPFHDQNMFDANTLWSQPKRAAA